MLDCARVDLCQPLHIKPYRTLNMPLYAGKYEKILYCLIYTNERGIWNLTRWITCYTPSESSDWKVIVSRASQTHKGFRSSCKSRSPRPKLPSILNNYKASGPMSQILNEVLLVYWWTVRMSCSGDEVMVGTRD